MRPTLRLRLGIASAVVSAGLLLLCGCGGPPPPPEPGPRTSALRLFDLAGSPEPSDEALVSLFGPLGSEGDAAVLRDLLDHLSGVANPEVEIVQPLPGLDRVAVDLTATLPSGGSARYSVQILPESETEFRIVWFHGPGVAWPPQARVRGEGLSTSAPPEARD